MTEIQKAISLLKDNGYEVRKIIIDKGDEYTFDNVWNLYEKKVGCKDKLRKKWNSMSKADRRAATEFIPSYVLSTPDKTYRKNFQTFLNQRGWEDELIGATPPPLTPPKPNYNEDGKTIGERWKECNQQRNLGDYADRAMSATISNMLEEIKKKPNSPVRRSLEIFYEEGTMQRLGFDWQP